MTLQVGALVRVRQQNWLVEDVQARQNDSEADSVGLACVDDAAQGQLLTVLWQAELDAKVFDENAWDRVGNRGFDEMYLQPTCTRVVGTASPRLTKGCSRRCRP